MTLSSKQVLGVLAIFGATLAGTYLAKEAATWILVMAVVSVASIAYAGFGGGPSLHGLVEAARRASSGEKPSIPPQTTGDVLRVYETLVAVAEQRRKDRDEVGAKRDQIAEYERTLEEIARAPRGERKVAGGRRPRRPRGSSKS